MAGYLVRTRSGDKGPYDLDRLAVLVTAGKLPIETKVIDAETGLAIALADLFVAPAEAPPEEEFRDEAEAGADPEADAPPSRGAPRRGAGRSGAGRSGRSPSAPGRPGARGAARGRAARSFRPGRRKSSPAPILIVLSVIGVIVVGFLYQRGKEIDRSLDGVWAMDPGATFETQVGTPLYRSMSTEQLELARQELESMAHTVSFSFRGPELTARYSSLRATGRYRVVNRNGGHYEIDLSHRGSTVIERLQFEVQGNRMLVKDPDSTSGAVGCVLVRK